MARSAGFYPPWKSVYTRFSRWSEQGIWQRVLAELAKDANTEGYLIDGTIVLRLRVRKVEAAQNAAGGERKIVVHECRGESRIPIARLISRLRQRTMAINLWFDDGHAGQFGQNNSHGKFGVT